MSCQDIFESIEREMVSELADDHEGDQAGPGNPSWDGFGWDRWAGHAVATLGAGIFGQDMNLHFQLPRDEIEFAGEVLADFLLGPPAAGAGLLVLGQIMLDADVREMVQTGSPRRAGGLGWLGRRLVGRGRHGRLGFGEDLGDVEEMTLARVVGKALAGGRRGSGAAGPRSRPTRRVVAATAGNRPRFARARVRVRRCGVVRLGLAVGQPGPAGASGPVRGDVRAPRCGVVRLRPAAATRRCGGAGRRATAGLDPDREASLV